MNNLVDLEKVIKNLENEKKNIWKRLNEISREIRAVETTLHIIKKNVNKAGNETEIPEKPEYQEIIKSLKYKRIRNKIKQLEAISKIAEVIGDENKNFRLNVAKKIMVAAGFFKTPKNANNILYTIIDRSGKFEKIEPGVYRPIEKEKNNSLFESS